MKKSFEAKGKTREEAIDAGLEALDLTIDEVIVEDIEEGSKGLFGLFGSRPWTVRLTAIEDDEKSAALDTHSLFADSLEEKKPEKKEKKPAEKKEKPARKPAEKKEEEQAAPAEKPAKKERSPRKRRKSLPRKRRNPRRRRNGPPASPVLRPKSSP